MKSIVEEASSIFKAVEKAWHRAGSPHEFRVTVFEDAQKNFIGMTTRSAKIALFFNENRVGEVGSSSKSINEEKKIAKEPDLKNSSERGTLPLKHSEKLKKDVREHERDKDRYKKQKDDSVQSAQGSLRLKKHAVWTPELIDAATAYVQACMKVISDKEISYTPVIQDSVFSLLLDNSFLTDPVKEQMFYRSLSYLTMESLSHRFKNATRTLQFNVKNS